MIRVLTADDLQKALPMESAIECMQKAFYDLQLSKATMPQRMVLSVEKPDNKVLIMPSYSAEGQTVSVKTLAIFNDNLSKGLPSTNGSVLVLNKQTGCLQAIIEASVLTAIRTGAVCGLATKLLSSLTSKVLAVFGSGPQACKQIEAVCAVRKILEVRIFSPRKQNAEKLLKSLKEAKWTSAIKFVLADAPTQAVLGADIICAATNSSSPVFDGSKLSKGVHVNAIGSYQPQVQEIDEETVQKALLVVDSKEHALAETGDLIIPIKKGLINQSHIYAELGELLHGKATRTSEQQITLFKSVGLAIQDNYAAEYALKLAELQNIGTNISF